MKSAIVFRICNNASENIKENTSSFNLESWKRKHWWWVQNCKITLCQISLKRASHEIKKLGIALFMNSILQIRIERVFLPTWSSSIGKNLQRVGKITLAFPKRGLRLTLHNTNGGSCIVGRPLNRPARLRLRHAKWHKSKSSSSRLW